MVNLFVSQHKYLRVIMSNTKRDDEDVSRQLQNLYGKGNTLTKNLVNCSDDVKCQFLRCIALL